MRQEGSQGLLSEAGDDLSEKGSTGYRDQELQNILFTTRLHQGVKKERNLTLKRPYRLTWN